MRILSAKITGNKRLQLAKISGIEIDFVALCQTIIGTNGSGKSTVLREYSPLPANSSDYIKGGGKEVQFLARDGEEYIATSEFNHGWLHSMIRVSDNVELNPGKTRQVQKQIVEQLTGLTEEIFDILVGDTTFTQMAPNKRREWILSFSGSDLEYAMKVYRDLNKRYMDSVALQKHYAKRLATELEGVLGEDQVEELKRDAKAYVDRINMLMLERDSNVDPTVNSEQIIDRLARAMASEENLFNRIADYKVVLPEGLSLDIQDSRDVDRIVANIQNDVDLKKRELAIAYEEHEAMKKYMDMLDRSGAGGVDDLKVELAHLDSTVETLTNQIDSHLDENDPAQAKWALNTILFEFIENINLLPSDVNEYEQKAEYTQRQIGTARDLIAKRTAEQREIDHKLYHWSNVEPVQCPDCTSVFAPGVDQHQMERLKVEYGTLDRTIEELNHSLEDLIGFASEYDQYKQRVNRIQSIMREYQVLNPLWNMIRTHIDTNQPAMMINGIVHSYAADMDLSIQIYNLKKERYTKGLILESALAITQGHGDVSADRITRIEQRIKLIMSEIDDANAHINAIRAFSRSVVDLDSLNEKHREVINAINVLTYNYQMTLRNECLDEDIGLLQGQLAVTQSKLSDATTAHALIEDLRVCKRSADEDVIVHKALVNGLSPSNGLIGKRIRSFADRFIAQMNAYIGTVWTYPMQIIAGDMDAAVDCKFPLESEGELSDGKIKVVSPDIAKSSSAQTDIINIAFRLTAMLCLGLNDFPLYLDEAGVRMDEKHRDRFNGLIEQLMERKQVSQVFMISHYAAMHGVFTNADITVIDKANIINIPREYNQNAVITYME